jgi:predicted PurR-regulated permease PerM
MAVPRRDWPPSAIAAARLVSLAVVCCALYFGQPVLLPLVLAALLTFLLSPLVTRLDRIHIPRVAGVLIVMTLVTAGAGGLGYVVTGQLNDFAAELPEHRANIRAKLSELTALMRGGAIENVQDTIEEISEVVGDPEEPTPVAVEREPLGGSQVLGPLFGAVGTLGLTVLLAIFMLVNREDLRNRLVSVAGRASLAVTTKAFADAGARIGRFLLMQFIINATMGIAVGIGLWLIGVPYAALFGLAAAVLRYVPYIGPWIAALLPITVSLVTSPGWEQVLIVIAMFLVLELLSNNVMEPLLYGQSVGLSSLAVIVSAIFWTWLWGAAGLVIATPLTACLVVLSSYVPELGVLSRLLGQKPALPTHVSLYQRWLARDVDEADEILERFGREHEHGLEEICELLLRTLLSLRRDLNGGRLDDEDSLFVCERLSEAIAELPGAAKDADAHAADAHATDAHAADATAAVTDTVAAVAVDGAARIVGVPVRDLLDSIALELARAQLRADPVTFEILPPPGMIGEVVAAVTAKTPAVAVVLSLAPGGLAPARHLCRRLRGSDKSLNLLAARLGDSTEDQEARAAQLKDAGCTEVVASLSELVARLKIAARSG